MDWEHLLTKTRLREILGGSHSRRTPKESRTEFERDYGRTVFSTPVRRLQDKAQVFPLSQNDSVRTRLTHSMEVSSLARSFGSLVATWLRDEGEIGSDDARAIESISATCGLLHDLGNPPFGHAGEDAIREWCNSTVDVEALFGCEERLAKDFLKWDGNAQTFRLISRLQVLVDEFGLNLTCATMSAACKYVAPSDQIDETKKKHEWSKLGYFFSEDDRVTAVRDYTGTLNVRHPITFLVEASDDIVYSTVDLEDGIKKRLITWDQLEMELLDRTASCPHTKAALKLAKDTVRGFSLTGQTKDEALVQAFRTHAISRIVPTVFDTFKSSYELIMEGKYHEELTKKCSARRLIRACVDIARNHIYNCDEIHGLELRGRKIIQDLLDIFWEAARSSPDGKGFDNKSFDLLSNNYKQVFKSAMKNDGNPDHRKYYQLQLACDYISGMTDTFAMNLHKSLFNG